MAAIAAGLTPLALEQPASAYDSVVAMLQSHLVMCQRPADVNGETFMIIMIVISLIKLYPLTTGAE